MMQLMDHRCHQQWRRNWRQLIRQSTPWQTWWMEAACWQCHLGQGDLQWEGTQRSCHKRWNQWTDAQGKGFHWVHWCKALWTGGTWELETSFCWFKRHEQLCLKWGPRNSGQHQKCCWKEATMFPMTVFLRETMDTIRWKGNQNEDDQHDCNEQPCSPCVKGPMKEGPKKAQK